MEIDGDLLGALAQPVRNQAAQQAIPLLLQLENTSDWQLLSQIAAHGIGIGCARQVGTGRLDRDAAGGGQQQAPQIVGLAAVAVGGEWDVLARDDHGIMQGLLVGQTDRLDKCRFAHHGPPFASGRSMLQPANLHFLVA
jgi:hypothetical protein